MTGRTLVGMAWAYGSYVAGRLMVLVATAILARLLTPKDFGLVALAVSFTAFLDVVRSLGPNEWLVVVAESEVMEWAETVWVVNVGLGLALTLAAAVVGRVVASFFHEPRLVAIVAVLGANFFVGSLSYVHYALAQKRMDFRARTVAELAEVVARGLVGIGLALAGAGVWALVLGYVAGTLAMTAALWITVPWRPSFAWRREHLPRLWRFGGALGGVGLMAAMLAQFDNLVVARVLGAAALGLYALATRLPELLIINLSVVAGEVLFPAFATFKRSEMGRPFLTSLHYALVVALPMTAFLAVLARPLIMAAFGPKWHGAVGAMQVLTLWALISPISLVCGTAYKALGRAGLLLRLALVQVALWVPLVLLLAHRGIVAVSGAQAGVAAVMAAASLVIMSRMLAVGPGQLLSVSWAPVGAAAVLAGALWGMLQLVSSTWPAILGGAVVAGVVYPGLLWWWDRPTLMRLLGVVVPRLRPASGSLAEVGEPLGPALSSPVEAL